MAHDIDTLLGASPIMAIFRNMTPDAAVTLAHRAWDLGIDLVEVPIQTADAVPSLEAVIRSTCRATPGRSLRKAIASSPSAQEASAQSTGFPATTTCVAPAARRAEAASLPHSAYAASVPARHTTAWPS